MIIGTLNSDFLPGTPTDDIIVGLAEDDLIAGFQGNDLLFGNQGNDTIYGGQGNDTIYGGQGNDLLIGDLGADLLFGDTGDDLFVMSRRTGAGTLEQTNIIADFGKGRDRLLLLDGLKFADLNLILNAGNLILQDTLTNQFLAILPGINQLTNSDVISLLGGLESGQFLPIQATTNINGQTLELEVASTLEQQSIGLMGRTELADQQGMLFPINPLRPVQLWMKDTLIPLDMIFLQNGVVQQIVLNAQPCLTDPCPLYGSPQLISDQVLELPGGRASQLNIQLGDFLNIVEIPSNLQSNPISSVTTFL